MAIYYLKKGKTAEDKAIDDAQVSEVVKNTLKVIEEKGLGILMDILVNMFPHYQEGEKKAMIDLSSCFCGDKGDRCKPSKLCNTPQYVDNKDPLIVFCKFRTQQQQISFPA